MDGKDIQELIKSCLLHDREPLRQSAIRLLAETNERMLAEGIPEEIVAIMSARAISRLMGLSMSEIGRKLFPIEELPPGALPYYSEPDPEEK